jgi:hypothetical protein
MVDEEAVEEVGIISFERGEVEIFVDIRPPTVDHPHSSCTLCFQTFESMRYEAGEVFGNSFVRTE